MPLCSACKSKTSTLQCPYECLSGLLFCGRHVKVKDSRIWATVNNIDIKVTLIQKIWKGYHIRELLRLAGPGVLNRSTCGNKEELFTFDDAKSVSPFNYFAFEENGQIYWFDIRSLLQCLDTTNELINPYTRQPVSSDSKKRLHKLHIYRIRKKLPLSQTEDSIRPMDQILLNRFRHISHILQAYEFFGVDPQLFIGIGPINIDFYVLSLFEGFSQWANEHIDKRNSRRHKYLLFIHELPIKFQHCSYKQYMYVLSSILLFILNDCSDPFHACFIIMSGFHRM